MTGVIRLFSNAYLTKKTVPRKKAKPPIQANSFTPRTDSRLILEAGVGGLVVGAEETGGGTFGVGTTDGEIGADAATGTDGAAPADAVGAPSSLSFRARKSRCS